MIAEYWAIRFNLDDGDIVLFSGKGFVSRLIIRFCSWLRGQKAQYSHIGVIHRVQDRVLLFESTTMGFDSDKGVQIHLLSEVVKAYTGKMVIRQLKTERTPETRQVYKNFIEANLGKSYEKHLHELIGAATPWHAFTSNNDDFFCSELVAKVYQIWNILPPKPYAKEYAPQDFAYEGVVDSMMLGHSARLGIEIEVKD